MTKQDSDSASGQVRDDFVPKEAYYTPEFLKREKEKLWPRVWQVACRLEEIPHVGDFVTYDIADDSLIIMRTSEIEIKAMHNVCTHRGRRLTEGCGHLKQIVCRFHGWRWNIKGENTAVIDAQDYGDRLKPEDIRLGEALVDTWGGFVWINMDLDAEPLLDFLAPLEERLKLYEFEKLRFRWYKTVVAPCNWKVALEAFDEGYHVQTSHQQFLPFIDSYAGSRAYGPHGAFGYAENPPAPDRYGFVRSFRLPGEAGPDYRQYILDYVEEFHNELRAMVTPRAYEATQRLRTECPADATQMEVYEKWIQFQREAAEADGSGWPEMSPEYAMASEADWHVFPNTVFVHGGIDGVLWYRARPNGDDPDTCIFDVWSLVRYAPGKEPPLERQFFKTWEEHDDWGRVLMQDLQNFPEVQRGMKSRGFKGSRTNPVQEVAVSNFHRALHEFLQDEPEGDKSRGSVSPFRKKASD